MTSVVYSQMYIFFAVHVHIFLLKSGHENNKTSAVPFAIFYFCLRQNGAEMYVNHV